MEKTITITTVINKLIIYIVVCGLLPLVIKKTFFNNLDKKILEFLDLIIIIISNIVYTHHLTTVYSVMLFNNITLKNILISIACSILFFILLDKNLDSLMNSYTTIIALVISTILFAILHFNFVQTLSAMICGFILGLIYIMTGSLFCCVLTHSLYNTISYILLIPFKEYS